MPLSVLDDANLELAVEAITWSAFGTTGQRCTATSRLIVQSGIKSKLIEALVEKSKTLKVGNGLDDATNVGPLVNAKGRDKVEKYVAIGKQEKAQNSWSVVNGQVMAKVISMPLPSFQRSAAICELPAKKSLGRC